MLLSLHIRDFAIIDTLEVEFSQGLSALTGETGAGKSILLDALGLLLGDRADAGGVRHGCERAQVSALFDLTHCEAARQWLAAQDMDQGEECQLRRVVSREGRSRAYINGSPVPVASLRELGEYLVDIHGQHEHQSLLRRDLQRELLDARAGDTQALQRLRTLFRDWQATRTAIDELLGDDGDRDTRLEFLSFQLQELDTLAPEPGEAERLHGELRQLSNAGELIATCQRHLAALDENDGSADSLLGKASQAFADIADIDPVFAQAGALFDGALIQLREGNELLRDTLERLDQDPERLQWVEQRLDALHAAARKHRVASEQLPDLHLRLREDIERLQQADQTLVALEQKRDRLETDYRKHAARLHKTRAATARLIGREVSDAMQTLGMPGGRFEIAVQARDDATPSAHGSDSIEFLVSANPGQPLKALNKVASGGELSRISLAIQVVAARDTTIPTLIFDEVDSGVGGAVAETVGRLLQTLGTHHQVLCVTHLAQVAAQAHNHLKVAKQRGRKHTRTGIDRLTNAQRVDEIARMLGGQTITDSTLQHAEEMLLMAPGEADTPGPQATH